MSSLFNGDQDPFEIMKMHMYTHKIQPTILDVYRFPEVHPQLSPVVGEDHMDRMQNSNSRFNQRSSMLTRFTYMHIVFLHVISLEEKYEKGSFPSHFADEETEGQWWVETQPKVTE